MSEEKRPGGPDLTQDLRPAEFTEGKLLGHVADDEVLPVQVGSEILAILTAAAITGRLQTGPWLTTPFAVLGIMLASRCEPAKRRGHPR